MTKTAAYEEISEEKANGPFEIVNRVEKYINLFALSTLTEDSIHTTPACQRNRREKRHGTP